MIYSKELKFMSTNDGYIPITELTIVSVKSMCAHTFIPSFLINFAVTLMLTWIWIACILYYDTILYCDGLCIELCNIVLIFVLFFIYVYIWATYLFRNHRQHDQLHNNKCIPQLWYRHWYIVHDQNKLCFQLCKYFLKEKWIKC